MAVSISETIGTLRADLRRVEITLGARIDARVAANELWLRDEVRREHEELVAELHRFREDVIGSLAAAREQFRRDIDAVADSLHHDIHRMAKRPIEPEDRGDPLETTVSLGPRP